MPRLKTFETRPISPVETETGEKRQKLTLYLLRHGESESDKSKATRGLTEKGQAQVSESVNMIFDQILQEENPEFTDWDNKEAKQKALAEAVKNIEWHLRDSGTDRTVQQVWQEYQMLKEIGVDDKNINLPKTLFQEKFNYLIPEGTEQKGKGPGIGKRLKGIQRLSPHWRMEVLRSEKFQRQVGIKEPDVGKEVVAWALSPEDEVPRGTETRQEMEARYDKDISKSEKVINRLTQSYSKRVITIANSHASIATLAAAKEMNIPVEKLMDKINEMPEAQGLRYDFWGEGQAHTTKPFGKDITKAVEELREK